MYIENNSGLPVYYWLEPQSIEDNAKKQIEHLTRLPFAVQRIAIMPDAHTGYGMPIGAVLAARGAIVPNAVGMDIGCGMQAVRLDVRREKLQGKINEIAHEITRAIPRGRNQHRKKHEHRLFDELPDIFTVKKQLDNMQFQLGTLGGGNHFIEIQYDEENYCWLMLHSGSRNLGAQLCRHYHAIARSENHFEVPDEYALAALRTDSESGAEYLAAMGFAVRYARANRDEMMKAVLNAVGRELSLNSGAIIDTCHNYAAEEEHFGERLLIHRKGAVRATGNVILPGAMGRASYICRGLANAESFMSCSHGAGRVMSRSLAMKTFTPDEIKTQLNASGILLKAGWSSVPEEAPGAYKNIEAVLDAQRDLLEPLHKLTALAVIKE